MDNILYLQNIFNITSNELIINGQVSYFWLASCLTGVVSTAADIKGNLCFSSITFFKQVFIVPQENCWMVWKNDESLGWCQFFPQPGSTMFSHNYQKLKLQNSGNGWQGTREAGWELRAGENDWESNCSRVETVKWEECNMGSERAVTQKTVTHTEHLKILCHSNRNN